MPVIVSSPSTKASAATAEASSTRRRFTRRDAAGAVYTLAGGAPYGAVGPGT